MTARRAIGRCGSNPGGAGRLRRVAVPLLALTLLAGCDFSRIQELEEQVQVARSEIEVELQRRAEMVPSLLETLQEHSPVSSELTAEVAEARVRLLDAIRSGEVANMEQASAALARALQDLLAAARVDRGLRDSAGFQLLSRQLEGTRQRIATAGDNYNEAVGRFNDYIASFPQAVTAKVIGVEKLERFDPPEESGEPSPADQ